MALQQAESPSAQVAVVSPPVPVLAAALEPRLVGAVAQSLDEVVVDKPAGGNPSPADERMALHPGTLLAA
jgi:hypothetical protein